MIEETRQDEAIRYVFGEMSEAGERAFQAALSGDAELRKFVEEVEKSIASLALSLAPKEPPSGLLGRIREELRSEAASEQPGRRRWLPWAVAACLAFACGALAVREAALRRDRTTLEERSQTAAARVETLELAQTESAQEITRLRQSVDDAQLQATALAQRDALAQIRIASLSAKVEAYAKAGVIVVWDEEQKRGVVKLTQLPAVDAQHDYQLWVIDPALPQPVSAGIVTIDAAGGARAMFHPALAVSGSPQFAVSLEPKGGSPTPQGQVIFAGQ